MPRTMVLPEWIEGGVGGGGGGGHAFNVESKSANFNAVSGKTYITTGAISVQLPASTSNAYVIIKKSDSNTVTIVPDGLDEIEGNNSNYQLTSNKESATLVSDGTNWFRI